MKRNLTITTAAAALLVGTVFAAAQGVQRNAPSGGTPEVGAQGGAQGQGGAQVAPQDGGKGKAQQQPRAQGPAAPEGGKAQSKEPRTQGQGGQAPREQNQREQGQRDQGQPQQQGQQPKQQPQQGQQTPSRDNGQKGAETKKGGGAQTGGVTLNAEQRTTIRNTVLKAGNAPRVTNVNFSVNVGTVVPRSVKVVTVPPTLIEIHPEWRGYMYFIVGERIVIIEPDSYRIVAVLVV